MKRLRILPTLFLALFVIKTHAAETEPNNTKAQANTLALNGSNTGAINIAGDEDWWKVTTNAEGELKVTISVSNSLYLYCYIYDNNGTTELNKGYSSGTGVISTDGLAAGTYYIKLVPYYSGQLPAYTVSNQLVTPAQANDTEPNDGKAQAITLPLNGSKTGHSGYYYNNKRDSADWYKITTNADGRLRISLSSANGQYIYAHLYDNDGSTLIDQGYTSGASAVVNADGLAAGTYYVKVRMYYTNGFIPYTIADSLFVPAQANDSEPNDTKAQSVTLPLNGSKTGHAGYFYNNKRDSIDWYKIITDKDGSLRLTMASGNGQYIYVYLYDNNGTILLDKGYTSGANAVVHVDGLAAGTYYAKVNCYYANGFVPYTLSDSLFAYSNTVDEEPNKKPYQAKTILANQATKGHIGFYYDNARDTVDWWKINYTGKGDLSFIIDQEPLKLGGYNYLYFQVYKDTTKSPIHSSYSSAASRQVDLVSLTQGYYWIKVYAYYSSDVSSYSITNTFTQANIAGLQVTSYDTPGSCASVNSISFKASKSNAPYTIQLYRFGVAYGNPVSTKKQYTFTNLPSGFYYATAYGDGATGSAFGTSKSVVVEPIPAGLNTTNIQSKQAKLNWSSISCADYYIIQYKVHGTSVWTKKNTTGNVNTYVLKNLTPNTQYDWRIATADSANGITASGIYADSIRFTTSSSLLIAGADDSEDDLRVNSLNHIFEVSTTPNPATSRFLIRYKNHTKEKVSATLYNAGGKAVWTSGLMQGDVLNGKQVTTDQFASGLYFLKIINEKGNMVGNTRVSIVK